MLAENDIVRVVVNQRFILTNEPMLNVFHYLAVDVVGDWTSPTSYANIAAEILIPMNEYVGAFQTTDVAYDNAVATNLTDGLSFGTYIPPVDLFGATVGSTEPLQVAVSFKLTRSTLATRNGSKRFGGIADVLVTDATGQGIAGLTQTATLEDWLASPIEMVNGSGDTAVLLPIVLRQSAVGVPPTVYSIVASAQFRGVGSQNSRKQLL